MVIGIELDGFGVAEVWSAMAESSFLGRDPRGECEEERAGAGEDVSDLTVCGGVR